MDNNKTIPGIRPNPIMGADKLKGERRLCARVPTISVHTEVKIKPCLLCKPEWQGVRMIDFNRLGIAFLSEHKLDIGERVELQIKLKLDSTDVDLHDLTASIKSITPDDKRLRYGASFNIEETTEETQTKLKSLEGVIQRAIKRAGLSQGRK